ncbi:hypothetical protein BDP27DRAFT_1342956 [Rhodocollybia butyracea]|uniref:C2 domain-containing protein n=1 Tax=Rhodocollybia butyracea TaxID=206335 RepID=A0A9P5TXH4_9AGAR|nr:hypothetical protein BDP27DRAFT_1342956 [Rhodocollybia butyracea]
MGSVHITLIRLHLPSIEKDLANTGTTLLANSRKYFAKVTVDGTTQATASTIVSEGWNEQLKFSNIHDPSKFMIEIFKWRKFRQDELVGTYEEGLENLFLKSLNRSQSIIQPLRGTSTNLARIEFNVVVETSEESVAIAAMVQRAKMRAFRLQRSMSSANSKANSIIQTADGASPSIDNVVESFVPLLQKLQLFSNLADSVAEVHPYADAAYSIVSLAYKVVLAQMQRDANILALIDVMDDIYSFVKEAEPLRQIESQQKVMICIAQQTTECGYFVSAYCSDSFFVRTMKHSVASTDAAIVDYGKRFSELKAALLDHATINTEITVLRILDVVERIETKVDLGDLPYADGARFQQSKRCLPGTRETILSKIINWIDAPPPDQKRVFLLTGAAGTGKSAIAHSVAHHYDSLGRLGSSVFADLPDKLDRLPSLIFPTIARDLADLDPKYRQRLWSVIEPNKALRKGLDPVDQLEKFILAPWNSLNAIAGPIVIVIDSLDNCSSSQMLNQFLSVLARRAHDFPPNFRIFITARTESRVLQAYGDRWSAKYDLSQVSKSRLRDRLTKEQLKQFDDSVVSQLVEQSRGSFQIYACNVICGIDSDAALKLSPIERYQALIPHPLNSRDPVQPDDILYKQELDTIAAAQGPSFMGQFKAVMGHLLAAYVPLSISELKQLSDNPQKCAILGALGGLLQNTIYLYTAITPFHSSFYDFLRNPVRSGKFSVDTSGSLSLAKACLRVLKGQLCFNICHLATSYLPNTDVNDLPDRIAKYITPELSYASRFWIKHIVRTSHETFGPEAERFLQTRFFFWLEVLSILGCVKIAINGLQDLRSWGCVNIAGKALSFVQIFEPAITLSAPHIYVSAVRFSPAQNLELFQPRFTFPSISTTQTVQHLFNHVESWEINSVAFSPERNSIVVAGKDLRKRHTCQYYVWDLLTNKISKLINWDYTHYRDRVPASAVFSHNGKTIIVVLPTAQVQILDVGTGKVQSRHDCDDGKRYPVSVSRGALQPDGQRLALVKYNHSADRPSPYSVSIYDTKSGDLDLGPLDTKILANLLPHKYQIMEKLTSMIFSSQGTFLVFGTDEGSIWIRDARATGDEVFVYRNAYLSLIQVTSIKSFAFSPDERHLFIGCRSTTNGAFESIIRVDLDKQSVQTVKVVWEQMPEKPHYQFTISPTGRYLVLALDNSLRFIDLESPESDYIPPLMTSCQAMSFSNDETMIAVADSDGTVHVWQVSAPFVGKHSLWGRGHSSGWIYGPNKELLAWAPVELRERLNWNPLVSGDTHGTLWTNCHAKDLIYDNSKPVNFRGIF